MKKARKRIMALLIAAAVLGSCTTVFAGIEDFSFYVSNTGQSYTPNLYGGGNQKSFSGDEWCTKVSNISFSKGNTGAGMAFILYRGSSKASAICWAASKGARHGYWGGYSGAANYTYYLYGRMDDDLSGTCDSSGYWNSDTINAWF